MDIRFNVNLKEILRLYRGLSPAVQRRVARRALEKAAKPMTSALRREVRAIRSEASTGVLGNSIGVVARTRRNSLQTSVRIGAIRKPPVSVSLKSNRTRAARAGSGGAYRLRNVVRKGSRYFHLADKNRKGNRRVIRLFAQCRTQMAHDLANEVEFGMLREARRLGARQ